MTASRSRGGIAARKPALTFWAAGLASGALIAADPPTLVAIAVLFAPSLLMRIADRDRERRGAIAVLLCNGAAAIAPLASIWRAGPPDLDRVLNVLAQPRMLFASWIAASLAWLGSEVLTVAAYRVLTARAKREVRRLDAEAAALRLEWELDPAK